jgi:hypothetical protein
VFPNPKTNLSDPQHWILITTDDRPDYLTSLISIGNRIPTISQTSNGCGQTLNIMSPGKKKMFSGTNSYHKSRSRIILLEPEPLREAAPTAPSLPVSDPNLMLSLG